jgi:hypothetical protein
MPMTTATGDTATDQARDKAQEVGSQAKEKAQEAGAQARSRVRDEVDRRRVFVEVTDEMLERAAQVYGPLAARSEELLGSLTAEPLRVMIDVLKRGAEMQLERAAELREELEARQGSTTR